MRPLAKSKKSALQENQGVSQSEFTSASSISKLKKKRRQTIDDNSLITDLLNQDIAALSRAITLVESHHHEHIERANKIINACLPYANKSLRIGITGVPGVGKSTFIESFGKHLTALGKRVAVLAIDPSSAISKGSILGDKTRMETLVTDTNAFIRPSATGATLGGVARKTRETITLCEAAGYDVIIIETVGVGQSETTVHSMVDFFLLLQLTGAGDDLQGIKRGVIEMADLIAINKADGDNIMKAKRTKSDMERTLHLYPIKASGWLPQVLTCSAINNEGISKIWENILEYFNLTKHNGNFEAKRHEQNKYWLFQTIEYHLKTRFFNDDKIKTEIKKQLELISKNKTTPFAAADYLLSI